VSSSWGSALSDMTAISPITRRTEMPRLYFRRCLLISIPREIGAKPHPGMDDIEAGEKSEPIHNRKGAAASCEVIVSSNIFRPSMPFRGIPQAVRHPRDVCGCHDPHPDRRTRAERIMDLCETASNPACLTDGRSPSRCRMQ
jgi:hypothetical protein